LIEVAASVCSQSKLSKSWATKRRTILGLAKKRKKKVVAKKEAKSKELQKRCI
jgi:hypothetical protein